MEDFSVVSLINQEYGVYGRATAMALTNPQRQLILIFGGTNDLSDVIADIKSAAQTPWPEVDPTRKAQFVYGILTVFNSVFKPWLVSIMAILRGAKGITLLGHSAGGTFALLTGMLLKLKYNTSSVTYIYATSIFGNLAAKRLMERTGLEIYDVMAENDPIVAIKMPWACRIGNGAVPPQRNYVITGPVTEAKLSATSSISWGINPVYASRHSLTKTYIPCLENIIAVAQGGTWCTHNTSAPRDDPGKRCAGASALCVSNGKLVPCGAQGWCGSNGICVSKNEPYTCNAAKDCNVGGMCVSPGYHWPMSPWDSITETCKSGATCSLNPWDFQKYCWNK